MRTRPTWQQIIQANQREADAWKTAYEASQQRVAQLETKLSGLGFDAQPSPPPPLPDLLAKAIAAECEGRPDIRRKYERYAVEALAQGADVQTILDEVQR